MENRQIFGLVGSFTLTIGVFCPIASMPFVGSVSYFQNGQGIGSIVLVLALLSSALVFAKRYNLLWFTALSVIGIMAYTFINFQLKIGDFKADMASSMVGNPFNGLASIAADGVRLEWGWGVLLVGCILTIAAAAIDGGFDKLKFFLIRIGSFVLMSLRSFLS